MLENFSLEVHQGRKVQILKLVQMTIVLNYGHKKVFFESGFAENDVESPSKKKK